MAGESLYQGEPDFMKKKVTKKPNASGQQPKGKQMDQFGKQGDPISGLIKDVLGGPGTDEEQGFTPPDKVTKGTGSQALISQLREKRAKNPVDMYLANKRKREEENRFA